jgi:hypothetical protein
MMCPVALGDPVATSLQTSLQEWTPLRQVTDLPHPLSDLFCLFLKPPSHGHTDFVTLPRPRLNLATFVGQVSGLATCHWQLSPSQRPFYVYLTLRTVGSVPDLVLVIREARDVLNVFVASAREVYEYRLILWQ